MIQLASKFHALVSRPMNTLTFVGARDGAQMEARRGGDAGTSANVTVFMKGGTKEISELEKSHSKPVPNSKLETRNSDSLHLFHSFPTEPVRGG